jgi:endonuclease/exonuclease/phosphatase family metal-dependent hydrolase
MGWRQALVAAAAVFQATCGSVSPTGPSDVRTSSAFLPLERPFSVMTFNAQQGFTSRGRYDLQRAVEVIARVQPDLVGVQELTRNHPVHQCDDQPAVIAEGLRNATGRPWTYVYVKEWDTPDRTCMDRGIGNEPESEGLAFFTPDRIESETHIPLYASRVAIAARVRTVSLPVIVTHLASGGGTAVTQRARQLSELLPWAASQGTPRILLGDFNGFPDNPELMPVRQEYRDAWDDAEAAGAAVGAVGSTTRVGKQGRYDYVYYVPGERLRLESAEVVDTFITGLGDASDHRPVLARFRVRP